MKNFKASIFKDIIVFSLFSVIVLILVILGFSGVVEKLGFVNKNMYMFDIGISLGIEIVMVYFVTKDIIALNNPEKLKKLYIEENDERTKFISSKVGSSSSNAVILMLLLAGIVAGYFNFTVFVTLIAAALASSLITVGLKIYYEHKF